MDDMERKLDNFQKIVEKEAIEKKRQIEDEVREAKKVRIEEEINRLTTLSQKRVNEEKARIENDYKQQSSKEIYKYKKELLMKRDEIINQVFSDVKKRIENYMATGEYLKYLINCIQDASKSFRSEDLTVYLMEKDFEKRTDVEKILTNIKITWEKSDNIHIGGVIVKKSGTNLITDETFDQKLIEASDRFIYDSGLTIDEI